VPEADLETRLTREKESRSSTLPAGGRRRGTAGLGVPDREEPTHVEMNVFRKGKIKKIGDLAPSTLERIKKKEEYLLNPENTTLKIRLRRKKGEGLPANTIAKREGKKGKSSPPDGGSGRNVAERGRGTAD